jgi:hypothetical protein
MGDPQAPRACRRPTRRWQASLHARAGQGACPAATWAERAEGPAAKAAAAATRGWPARCRGFVDTRAARAAAFAEADEPSLPIPRRRTPPCSGATCGGPQQLPRRQCRRCWGPCGRRPPLANARRSVGRADVQPARLSGQSLRDICRRASRRQRRQSLGSGAPGQGGGSSGHTCPPPAAKRGRGAERRRSSAPPAAPVAMVAPGRLLAAAVAAAAAAVLTAKRVCRCGRRCSGLQGDRAESRGKQTAI